MILTADPATFYSLTPLPTRVIPFVRKAKYPPYGLRKIEAIVDGMIVPPEDLSRDIDILGIYVNDPLALTPVSSIYEALFGEKPRFYSSFMEFSAKISRLKKEKGFKVIVGGPGSWELVDNKPWWVDTIVLGEAENVIFEAMEKDGIIKGTPAERFHPIRAPSAFAEVEVMRGTDRKVPDWVVKKEMKVQSVHGRVNLISNDLFSYGDELYDLLTLAKSYGKVYFNQISLKGLSKVDLEEVRRILGLNERDYRTPVLSRDPGACTLSDKVDVDAIRELNKAFIYPMIYVPDERVDEYWGVKALVIPLPTSDRYYDYLYRAWLINERVIKSRFNKLVERVLEKNAKTKGEFLKRFNIRDIRYILSLFFEDFWSGNHILGQKS